MSALSIEVSKGGYPTWIKFTLDGNTLFTIKHTEFLRLENCMSEARREILCSLDKRDWHEFDPKFAAP